MAKKVYKARNYQSGMTELTMLFSHDGSFPDERILVEFRHGKMWVKSTHRKDRNVMTTPVEKTLLPGNTIIKANLTHRELHRLKTLYGEVVEKTLLPGNTITFRAAHMGWWISDPLGTDGKMTLCPLTEVKIVPQPCMTTIEVITSHEDPSSIEVTSSIEDTSP